MLYKEIKYHYIIIQHCNFKNIYCVVLSIPISYIFILMNKYYIFTIYNALKKNCDSKTRSMCY